MSDPMGGRSAQHRAKARARVDSMRAANEEAELMKEAYGNRGAAMRTTAKKMGEGLAKEDSTKRSVVSKVKKFFGGG